MSNPSLISSTRAVHPAPAGLVPFSFARFYMIWVVASVLGFGLGMALLALPGVSVIGTQSRAQDFMGYTVVDHTATILLYGLIGLASSVGQWWALRQIVDRAYFWTVATMLGALVGAAFLSPQPKVPWLLLSWYTALPIAVAQAIMLLPMVGPIKALLWVLVRTLTAILVATVGGFVAFAAASPSYGNDPGMVGMAVAMTIFVGLPIALITGLYITWAIRDGMHSMGQG